MEVVVSWNMPMHRWLKLYVFKQAKPRAGAGAAIVLTYLASTVLHGLTGQIAAVLFSLGAYTWVEHSLRAKLSNIMDASIGARRETETRKKVRRRVISTFFSSSPEYFSIARAVPGSF